MGRDKHSGKIIDGRYELIQLIDEGGMGAVYLGRHIKIGRRVAVKFLHAELAGNKEVVTRFYREAQAASAISHSNIIDVYDVGVSDWGDPYLVMEYLSGETLGSLLKRKGPIRLAAACGIMEPSLRALSAAHEAGIVHRDLKPENIFLMRQDDDTPVLKLIDFGISKFVQGENTKLTRTGALLGTPSYMSPEQARGKGDFDHRSDLYSMGVILNLMLTGELPFVGESYNDLIINILTESPRDPLKLFAGFPVEAEPIVKKLLEKEPDQRYANCAELIEALEALDAFEDRHEALAELMGDIPKESFATGDLGPHRENAEEVAATVFAGMGVSKTEKTPVEIPSVSPMEKKELVTSPPPSRRSRRKRGRSLWSTLLLALVLMGAGGFFIYSKGLLRLPNDTVLVKDNPTQQDKDDSDTLQDITAGTAVGSVEKREDDGAAAHPGTEQSSTDKGEVGQTGAAAPSPPNPPDLIGAEDQPEAAQPEPKVNLKPEDHSVEHHPAPASGAPDPAPGKKPASEVLKALTSPGDEKSAGDGSKEPPDQKNAYETPGASEGPIMLTAKMVNQLVETKNTKVTRCYDIARITDPALLGLLVVRVGIAGEEVIVSIEKNELSASLAACVVRALESITPPPNNGTLVEIEKEYEFRVSGE